MAKSEDCDYELVLLFQTMLNALKESCELINKTEQRVLRMMQEMDKDMVTLRSALDKYFLDDEPDVMLFEKEEERIRNQFHSIQKELLGISVRQNELGEKLKPLKNVQDKLKKLQNLPEEDPIIDMDWNPVQLAVAYKKEKDQLRAHSSIARDIASSDFHRVFDECQKSMFLVKGYCRTLPHESTPNEIIALILKFYYVMMELQNEGNKRQIDVNDKDLPSISDIKTIMH